MKYLSLTEYIPNLYNQIIMLRKWNRVIMRMDSYMGEEFYNINSILSDVIIKYSYSAEKDLVIHIWRRESEPMTVTGK